MRAYSPVVRRRKTQGERVRINPGFADAGWHDLEASAAYEWWYLDAISTDGRTAFVFIWFAGLPFSPDALTNHERGRPARAADHVAMFTAVYVEGKQIAYALNRHPESEFEAARESLNVRVGPNRLERFSNGDIAATVDAPMLFGGGRLSGTLRLSASGGQGAGIGEVAGAADHVWNPLVPSCELSGSLRLAGADGSEKWSSEFAGRGYLDHNYGSRPLTEGIRRWHWGRAHLGDTTIVYYHNEPKSGPHESVLAVIDASADPNCTDIQFSATDWRRRILCPRFPNTVAVTGLRGNDRVTFTARRRHIVDWGPFYMRFLCDVTATIRGRELSGTAITEYLDPRGLRARWLRPLIKTRIRMIRSGA